MHWNPLEFGVEMATGRYNRVNQILTAYRGHPEDIAASVLDLSRKLDALVANAPQGWDIPNMRMRTGGIDMPMFLAEKLPDVSAEPLRAPAESHADSGRVNHNTRFSCAVPRDCANSFSGGSLTRAVATGVARSEYNECCALRLDDPDLKPLTGSLDDYLKGRFPKLFPRGGVVDTKQSYIRTTSIMSRIYLKQAYLLNFISHANLRGAKDFDHITITRSQQ